MNRPSILQITVHAKIQAVQILCWNFDAEGLVQSSRAAVSLTNMEDNPPSTEITEVASSLRRHVFPQHLLLGTRFAIIVMIIEESLLF